MKRLDSQLYLLFTPALCQNDPWQTLEQAIRGGVDLVQWRVKNPAPDDREQLARAVALCRRHGVPLLVNDDLELALAIGADGVHLGQDDTPAAGARARLGADRWLGISTHDPAQIHAAEASGADYLGFGPCFASSTKGYRDGLAHSDSFDAALATASRPVFAIGGITAGNLAELTSRGVTRIAVCAAILASNDPGTAARALRQQLGEPPHSTNMASPNE